MVLSVKLSVETEVCKLLPEIALFGQASSRTNSSSFVIKS